MLHALGVMPRPPLSLCDHRSTRLRSPDRPSAAEALAAEMEQEAAAAALGSVVEA